MSIFTEIHKQRQFSGWDDHRELLRKLHELIGQSIVTEIRPSTDMKPSWDERWFVENGTGIVFRLLDPNPPDAGVWEEVEFPKRADV
jgi:hypothetical protein